ncbi:MAG: TlpA disulfide reductase family protein [Desulfuromonadales bacterium]|nr:TlpA disulfide reductase family protein [Desulfuromonadales bacterium]
MNKRIQTGVVIAVLLAGIVAGATPALATVAFGDQLPEVWLPAPTAAADRAYLGLGDAETFRPDQVRAELLLLEVLNVHCMHCQMQAPATNELYRLLQADPLTRQRVRLLAIALGNTAEEVERFRQQQQIPFPVVADPRFASYRQWGVSGTPFMISVLQNESAAGLVVATHGGLNTDYRRQFADVKTLLQSDPAQLRRQARQAEQRRALILPLLDENELQQRVRQVVLRQAAWLEQLAAVDLRSGRRVYRARVQTERGTELLFAEVVSRQSVCDICHDVHFIYLFDAAGRIVDFEPLQVTKYGNVHWNDAEAASMHRRLVGQFIAAPRPFDPRHDAVTSATISSAIIFDSIAQGEELLDELRTRGLLGRSE